MSDIRFNRWLHQSGTGGVFQHGAGHIGVGTDDPAAPVHTLNDKVLNVGIVTANQIHGTFHGDGSNLTGVSAFVTGMIMMYTGATAPSGWALCDGQNGTPDLRDRFIVSSGSSYNIDATGGSADAIVVSHTHTLTDPGHTHTYSRAETLQQVLQNTPVTKPSTMLIMELILLILIPLASPLIVQVHLELMQTYHLTMLLPSL